MFEIIIVLFAVLVIAAVIVNAVQQHKNKIESEKRAELSKHKQLVDEAEDLIAAAKHLPITPVMMRILYIRMASEMVEMLKVNPKLTDLKQRINATKEANEALQMAPTQPVDFEVALPNDEKKIILLIQGIKKLRMILRGEQRKGRVNRDVCKIEDKFLERYQLKVNMETLQKRINGALEAKMAGSARQYMEKAIAALKAQPNQDDYVTSTRMKFENQLANIHESLRSANAADQERRASEEKKELDDLFAPKKKW